MESIKAIILKHLRGEIAPEEQLKLDTWLATSEENRALFDELRNPDLLVVSLEKMDRLHEQQVWERLLAMGETADAQKAMTNEAEGQKAMQALDTGRSDVMTDEEEKNRFWSVRRRWWAAAAVLIVLGTGGYTWWRRPARVEGVKAIAARMRQDVLPGGNKAVLTLSGGRRIVLDSTAADTILTEGAAVIANAGGRLAYNAGKGPGVVVTYNTLSTPRGGQYQLTLPDGTKVWLNAVSSITYPTVFEGKEREVSLRGQAYFEVAGNDAMPFVVKVNNIDVKVLGTHFDVMAYEDELTWKMTLLEGGVSVGVAGNEQTRTVLRPGNQALVEAGGAAVKVVKDADLELAVAWKNGFTAFKSADIRSIMRQVERWYDMNVTYEGAIPHRVFTGKISRSANLSEVFNILEESNIHFKVEGKNIIVRP